MTKGRNLANGARLCSCYVSRETSVEARKTLKNNDKEKMFHRKPSAGPVATEGNPGVAMVKIGKNFGQNGWFFTQIDKFHAVLRDRDSTQGGNFAKPPPNPGSARRQNTTSAQRRDGSPPQSGLRLAIDGARALLALMVVGELAAPRSFKRQNRE